MDKDIIFTDYYNGRIIENPLEALYVSYVKDSNDFGATKRDAWRYGVIVGWDDAAYSVLSNKFSWSQSEIDLNKRLHAKYMEAWKIIQLVPKKPANQ